LTQPLRSLDVIFSWRLFDNAETSPTLSGAVATPGVSSPYLDSVSTTRHTYRQLRAANCCSVYRSRRLLPVNVSVWRRAPLPALKSSLYVVWVWNQTQHSALGATHRWRIQRGQPVVPPSALT